MRRIFTKKIPYIFDVNYFYQYLALNVISKFIALTLRFSSYILLFWILDDYFPPNPLLVTFNELRNTSRESLFQITRLSVITINYSPLQIFIHLSIFFDSSFFSWFLSHFFPFFPSSFYDCSFFILFYFIPTILVSLYSRHSTQELIHWQRQTEVNWLLYSIGISFSLHLFDFLDNCSFPSLFLTFLQILMGL